jgi:lysophospholipase L1-like esterase
MHQKRLPSVLLACLGWAAGLPLAIAQNPAQADKNTRYLALGDSLAAGFNPFASPADLAQNIGYPQIVSNIVHMKVANAACPGETSSSMIDTTDPLPGFTCGSNPTGILSTPAGPISAPIELGVPYQGARSQLDYAVNYLKSNPNPKLVTINIGGNDLVPLLTCTADCEAKAAAAIGKVANNLAAIYAALRSTGYTGPIVAATYYAFDYNDPRQVGVSGAFTALNHVIASVTTLFGGKVADVFGAFQAATSPSGKPCDVGLLMKQPNSMVCDPHPSLLGQALIAGAVAREVDKK